jgi:hypothetical protein
MHKILSFNANQSVLQTTHGDPVDPTKHAGVNPTKLFCSSTTKRQNKLERLSPGKTIQPCLLFAGKTGSLPLSGVPVGCYTRAVSDLTGTWLARKKHSSLFRLFQA